MCIDIWNPYLLPAPSSTPRLLLCAAAGIQWESKQIWIVFRAATITCDSNEILDLQNNRTIPYCTIPPVLILHASCIGIPLPFSSSYRIWGFKQKSDQNFHLTLKIWLCTADYTGQRLSELQWVPAQSLYSEWQSSNDHAWSPCDDYRGRFPFLVLYKQLPLSSSVPQDISENGSIVWSCRCQAP